MIATSESLRICPVYLKYLVHSRARRHGKFVNEKESLCMKEDGTKSLNRSIRTKASLVSVVSQF